MLTNKLEILRYHQDGTGEKIEDIVVVEKPLTIFVNGYEIATLLCTPADLKPLILGFLISEGFIKAVTDIVEMEFSHEKTVVSVKLGQEIKKTFYLRKRTLTSACGGGVTFMNLRDCAEAGEVNSSLTVSKKHIADLMAEMQSGSRIFQKTGGTHTAALADKDKLLFFAEDIGRHNTLDKIIGKALLQGLSFSNKVLLTSGRISSEMVLKALKRGIPVLASRSAPTMMALKIARERDMTVIGFIRGARMNLYTGGQRLQEEQD
ncbi:MAG TPA: formate dehydrogenase accessory sulfurtransferase FdhD [Halanaerobiales bacterium]|nr:formate dehydrogenase accessory sulfurtransferase FdhD [Halanaerobiales bacterium]